MSIITIPITSVQPYSHSFRYPAASTTLPLPFERILFFAHISNYTGAMSFKSSALLATLLAVPTFVCATFGHSHDHAIKSASICPAYCTMTVTSEVTKTVFASCTQSVNTTPISEPGSFNSASATEKVAPFNSGTTTGSAAPVYTLGINSTGGLAGKFPFS